MQFRKLTLSDWRQFEDVEIEFHPRLTVLTGANGSGKTALLRLLAYHFGWTYSEMRTPVREKTGLLKYMLKLKKREWQEGKLTDVGTLQYATSESRIQVPADASATYQLHFPQRQTVRGLFVSSHRPEYSYRALAQIPMTRLGALEAFDRPVSADRNRANAGGGEPFHYFMKEVLVSFGLLGYGNAVVVGDEQRRQLYEGFQDILRKILPPSLGFRSLSVRPPDVVLETKTGEFMLDAVSGGIGALLDLAWQIFMYAATTPGEFVAAIDEVENHLHPSLQRTVLPSLVDAFPSVQFVVATHSPFVVGSVRESTVYVLRYSDEQRVVSERLDLVNRAGPAAAVLREVLGVATTLPVWAEEFIESVVLEMEALALPPEQALTELRGRLEANGLGELAPNTLAEYAARRRQ